MSKPISIKAIIIKDSEACSNDFVMGVLRGLDVDENSIKLGAGGIKVELKDMSFGEILNVHARLKKNFNCFCVKVFWDDGRVQLLEECFRERSKHHRELIHTKNEVEDLKIEIDRYKIINGEISKINEKLNKRPRLDNVDDKIFLEQEIQQELELIDARMRLLQQTIQELIK